MFEDKEKRVIKDREKIRFPMKKISLVITFLIVGLILIVSSKNLGDESSKHVSSYISPNGLYRGDLYRGTYANKDRYYEFFVTDLKDDIKRKVFSGTPRTSDISWTEDNGIEITYNCGTGCRATKIIDTDEYLAISDYKEGEINEANGWDIQFFDIK